MRRHPAIYFSLRFRKSSSSSNDSEWRFGLCDKLRHPRLLLISNFRWIAKVGGVRGGGVTVHYGTSHEGMFGGYGCHPVSSSLPNLRFGSGSGSGQGLGFRFSFILFGSSASVSSRQLLAAAEAFASRLAFAASAASLTFVRRRTFFGLLLLLLPPFPSGLAPSPDRPPPAARAIPAAAPPPAIVAVTYSRRA